MLDHLMLTLSNLGLIPEEYADVQFMEFDEWKDRFISHENYIFRCSQINRFEWLERDKERNQILEK